MLFWAEANWEGTDIKKNSLPSLIYFCRTYIRKGSPPPHHSLSRRTEVNLQRYQPRGSGPTLCDLTDCSPAGSSVHGISRARILKWDAISEESKHQTLPTNPYHSLVSHYIWFSTICCPKSSIFFSFILSLMYKFIVLWFRGYRNPSSNHLFELLISTHSHGLCVACVNKFLFLFFLVILSFARNLDGKPRRGEGNFLFLSRTTWAVIPLQESSRFLCILSKISQQYVIKGLN